MWRPAGRAVVQRVDSSQGERTNRPSSIITGRRRSPPRRAGRSGSGAVRSCGSPPVLRRASSIVGRCGRGVRAMHHPGLVDAVDEGVLLLHRQRVHVGGAPDRRPEPSGGVDHADHAGCGRCRCAPRCPSGAPLGHQRPVRCYSKPISGCACRSRRMAVSFSCSRARTYTGLQRQASRRFHRVSGARPPNHDRAPREQQAQRSVGAASSQCASDAGRSQARVDGEVTAVDDQR